MSSPCCSIFGKDGKNADELRKSQNFYSGLAAASKVSKSAANANNLATGSRSLLLNNSLRVRLNSWEKSYCEMRDDIWRFFAGKKERIMKIFYPLLRIKS